jgi:SAM-dependent methyltransferase
MLRTLKQRFGRDNSVSIVQHNLDSHLPSLGYFDAVVSSLAIHHLKQERKEALYSEIYSILKSGGVFCNFDHFASRSPRLSQHFRRGLGGQRAPNRNHEARLNTVESEISLKKRGFVEVDCYWNGCNLHY